MTSLWLVKWLRVFIYNIDVICSKPHVIVFKILFLGVCAPDDVALTWQWILNEVLMMSRWALCEVAMT